MPIKKVTNDAMALGLEVLGDVRVRKRCENEELERMKEEKSRPLEKPNAYKMEKEKLEKTLVEMKVRFEEMTRSLADQKKL